MYVNAEYDAVFCVGKASYVMKVVSFEAVYIADVSMSKPDMFELVRSCSPSIFMLAPLTNSGSAPAALIPAMDICAAKQRK